MNDKFVGVLSNEKPILEMLLAKEKNNKLKSYSKFKNEKKITNNESK